MTVDNYGYNWHFDNTLPFSDFNLLGENQVRKYFDQTQLGNFLEINNLSERSRVEIRLYIFQKLMAHRFLKINALKSNPFFCDY